MRKLLFPFILGALTLAVIAAFTEASVRLLADDGLQFDLEMWKYARDVKVVSPDPLIGHEHGANRSAKLMGVEFETNSQGLRDREHTVERQAGVPRILMLGDSLTVGWGVPVDATFSKRIERLFAEKGATVEVVNTGVGNWNTVQETEYFLTKGHLYRPDIVRPELFHQRCGAGAAKPLAVVPNAPLLCVRIPQGPLRRLAETVFGAQDVAGLLLRTL